jgi:ComF family protein
MHADILPVITSLFRICADVVFPPVCHSCSARLPGGGSIACPSCLRAILPVDDWDDAYRKAFANLNDEQTVADFVAAWYFEHGGPLRPLMHRLKYGGMTSIGVEFGRALGARIREAGLGGSDMVVPLPLHASRMRERGYNQCEYIARGVSAVTGSPLRTGVLRRTRFTPSQTSLGHGERRENVRDAFALSPRALQAVAGRTVLLVDDVVTTGATMRSCAGALHRAGARAVIACAVAIAR